MIIKRTVEKDIYGRGPVEDVQYFGKDAEEFLKSIKWDKSINYLGKECTTDKGLQGIIIGIEDCNSFCDYYYIVYVPESKQVTYELANSADKYAMDYIYNKTGRKLTIYHMFESPRNIPEGYEPPIGIEEILDCSVSTISGFKSDEERDSAMTRDSDFDIVFVKDDRWDSGTAQNIKRRHNI